MNFTQAIASAFRNGLKFSGRAARSEYWYFYLFFALVNVAGFFIDEGTDALPATMGTAVTLIIIGAVLVVGGVALIIIWLALSVRRLHDLDKTGWWILIFFIPLAGVIVMLVWFCQRGTVGPNRFGSDPLEDRVSRDQAF